MIINLSRIVAFAFAALTLFSQSAIGAETDLGSDIDSIAQKAEQGDAIAQYNLGLMYYKGQGVLQDYKEAVKWYLKAAEQGHASAQFNLGLLYYRGQGVLQDYKKASKWYRKAVEQGNAPAQVNLGRMYASGRGVIQDYKEAVKWYRKAAEQGHAYAQSSLGVIYANGRGVLQDYVQAHAWYNVASANFSELVSELGSKKRDQVAELMTPEQIAKAQELAKEYFEKYQPKNEE